MNILDRVFSHESLINRPPVLVDVGASGEIHSVWKKIAKNSICIAFDPDEREFRAQESDSVFKKLMRVNRILSDQAGSKEFYLTKSPYCSSTLRPNEEKLQDWLFSDLFKVQSTGSMEAVTLPEILGQLSLDRVDWFKTDSQGTDLRIFKSLGDKLINIVIVAEFEPGINDSYVGEDKMHEVMAFMDKRNFWLENLAVQGTVRSKNKPEVFGIDRIDRQAISNSIPISSFWGEMRYLNSFQGPNLTIRDFLLGCVFSSTLGQHGFTYDLSCRGFELFSDPLFEDLRELSIKKIRQKYVSKLPRILTSAVSRRISRVGQLSINGVRGLFGQ